jgi:hypothetical protein
MTGFSRRWREIASLQSRIRPFPRQSAPSLHQLAAAGNGMSLRIKGSESLKIQMGFQRL